MQITLLNYTNNPLEKMGKVAGICWNSPIDKSEANVKRAIDCIRSGHNRVLEFVDIEFILDGASARMMRELYTHIGGSPTRLQSSTRYINSEDFEYYTPKKILTNQETNDIYKRTMETIAEGYSDLINANIPKEDAANLLPLGMNSKMVMKCNLRMLENLCNQRLCIRALNEIREFANELKKLLAKQNDEWKWIADNILVPKCEKNKFLNSSMCYCTETHSCGKYPKIENVVLINK